MKPVPPIANGVASLAEQRSALRRLADGEAAGRKADVAPLIRRGTQVMLIAIWALALLASLASAYLLLAHARSHSQVTAVGLEQFTKRNIGLAAFVVDEFKEFLDTRGGVTGIADDDAATAKLERLIKWLPSGSSALLVLPDGNVALSTEPLPAPSPNLSDRRWFRAHVDAGADSFVGPSILSRVYDRYIYTYTASYRAADGRLLAIIDLGIPSDTLTGLAPDKNVVDLAIVKYDGSVVAAEPFAPGLLATTLYLPERPRDQQTLFGRFLGSFSVVSIRNVPELGLYAVVAMPLVKLFEPLIWAVVLGSGLLLVLSNVMLNLSLLLQAKSVEVEQALADNKMLFQEVHHRVKNNLQVISSLLRLQTDRLPPEVRPLMEETSARVRAIALVHEQIYRTASPSTVQLDVFLAQLAKQLAASMIGGGVTIETALEPATIGLDRAVPVAILATEAITNAIKHGLDQGQGTIILSLRSAAGRNLLEVRDSGQASPAAEIRGGLGTRIMTALSRQIDGDWTLNSNPRQGTVFTLSWPVGS